MYFLTKSVRRTACITCKEICYSNDVSFLNIVPWVSMQQICENDKDSSDKTSLTSESREMNTLAQSVVNVARSGLCHETLQIKIIHS